MTTPFDITGDLPTGTWLLEASAGTGKTYTIAGLVVRHVAEGRARLDEMLVLTFGRLASAELRSRVRGALADAEQALARRLDGDLRATGDTVLDHLLDAPTDELTARLRRVGDALADVDAATIATTHQFCQRVLRSLGIAGDSDPGTELVDDLGDLVTEVADDLYLRGFARSQEPPDFSRADALAVARAATAESLAALWEDPAPDEGHPVRPHVRVRARRTAFARAVRAEVEVRKRRARVLSYDDLLTRLADALEEPDSLARRRVRERWRVVLVDEFQDTDPVQWQVLSRAFAGHATLVLVGDPKQAIYAFRGGDVQTYLAAAAECDHHGSLETNHRSDGRLVDGLHALLGGAELGDPEIVVREVAAAHVEPRLAGAAVDPGAPLRLRVLDRTRAGGNPRVAPGVERARGAVMKDLAAEVATLLTDGTTFDGRLLLPADIGILCRTSKQCEAARTALAAVGVRAVTGGGESVLRTEAADHWLRLLEALVSPQRPSRVRDAAATLFLGLTPQELVAGGDRLTERLSEELRDLAVLAQRRGVAAVHASLVEEHELYARVMARDDGERLITDLRHVAELLHETALRERLSLPAVTAWLRRQREEDRRGGAEERARRLDSDSDAVQVMTIHASKGLEFPVVMLPSVWDHHVREEHFPLFHDAEGNRRRDVGGQPFPPEVVEASAAELAGEELRLLYVAVMRAQSHLVLWWAPSEKNTPASALHRVLMGRTPDVGEVEQSVPVWPDERIIERLRRWEAHGGPLVQLVGPAREVARPEAAAPGPIRARAWTRRIDQDWRRTSYSALTAAAEAIDVPGSAESASNPEPEPEMQLRDDEQPVALDEPQTPRDHAADLAQPSPLRGQPGGAAFGSLVHAVLEHLDLEGVAEHGRVARVRTVIDEQLPRWPVGDVEPDALAEGLAQVLDAPLGPLAPGLTLATLAPRDRLTELDFEVPLAGGDDARASAGAPSGATLADLAALLRAHLTAEDPMRSFAERLDRPGYAAQSLRGYLSGSLDLVLRHDGRYLVADYKTNLLGADVDSDDLAAYTPDRLREAMLGSTYPLQALLYAAVLHRFLRWRLPGYDPEQHLGGVLYLYVRGMGGPATPVLDGHPTGVFSWQPPSALVVAVSDLLAGRLEEIEEEAS